MNSNTQLRIAYGLAVIFLIVGVAGYAAFSAKAPAEPIRMMYKTSAGKVLFGHKTHASSSGFGVACADCHHHPEGDDSATMGCGDCHGASGAEAKALETCAQCHEPDEYEGYEMMNRTDAFHGQCIGCHKEYEAGPVECSECHVM
jgi:hypothetical protein